MKLKTIFQLIFLIFPAIMNAQKVSIIPQPVSIEYADGNFILDSNTTINFNKANKDLSAAALFFSASLKNISGIQLHKNATLQKNIELKLANNSALNEEGYLLNISTNKIEILANKKAGIIYGMQTLLQMLPVIRTNATLKIPCLKIIDYPRFKWRGMHLDVSRHFYGPEFIKQYIDLLAAYKMNIFHWHLVDDQGWRIEIKKYPLLTKIGSWRVDKNNISWEERPQAKPGEPATYGGYYAQEQIKDIIQYAADRNVTIVPEIEMPGHVASAIAAYPQLSCTQQPQLPLTGGNYTGMASNYCAGNDSVFLFLQNVLTEVINLFPSPYIHMGGDEVDKAPWKKCPKCQARIKDEGLHNEEELQSYFIKRIEKFINDKGRKMIGWDEILEGGLAPDATVMSWRGEAGGIEAAKMKHDVVMTPGFPLYFNQYQAGPEGEPRANGGMNTLKNVYEYEPIPKELSPSQQKFVLGAQGNLWGEYIVNPLHVEYMILPRMLALAEVVWSPVQNKNWENFNQRLQHHFKRFDETGLQYSHGNFKVYIKPISNNGELTASLSTEMLGADIYYSLDGSIPSAQSKKYTKPILIENSATLKAVAILDGNVLSLVPAEQNFVMHKAIGKNVIYTHAVSKHYLADGPNSLTDGVRGKNDVSKYWQGFSGNDLIATIDLGKNEEIKSISLGCWQHYRDWIFMPSSVSFEISLDGINFSFINTSINDVPVNEKMPTIKDFAISFPVQTARYIRVKATNTKCPEGHPGAGKPAWIFADEIIVQ